jgi:hypothetical protein
MEPVSELEVSAHLLVVEYAPIRNRARQKCGLTGRNAPLLINYLLQHHT